MMLPAAEQSIAVYGVDRVGLAGLMPARIVIGRMSRLPWEARRNLRPEANEKSISMALKKAGATKLDRVSLGKKLETTGRESHRALGDQGSSHGA